MKMRNPRAGHGPAFGGIEIIYFMIGLVVGFPIALPFLFVAGFLSEVFGFKMSTPFMRISLYISMIAGTYVHFKLWQWLYLGLRAWWG